MKNAKFAVALAVFLGMLSATLDAQSVSITIEAVNGKNGKPLRHQRLLVFMGDSQKDVHLHKYSQDVTTDEQGNAVLQITKSTIQFMQVWVDYQTLCQSGPNQQSFSVAKIVASGEATPNNCSPLRRDLIPKELIVFARPATLRERMNW